MRAATRWVVLAGAAVAALWPTGCEEDPEFALDYRKPARATLFRFREFASVECLGGGEVSLEDLRGHVVALMLFGTWSDACRHTAPLTVSLYQRYHGRDFEILGLAYERTNDPRQAREAVRVFRDEFRIPYVLALGTEEVWQELRREAGVARELPTIVLLDRQGVARDVFEGFAPGSERVLAERIERLLAEPYGAPSGNGG